MKTYKKLLTVALAVIICMTGLTACGKNASDNQETADIVTQDISNPARDLKIELDEEDGVTDYNEEECVKISLDDNNINVTGDGVNVTESTVEITDSGSYIISGTLTDGCIKVNCAGKGTVRLILNGVNVTSATSEPLIIQDAKKTIITLATDSNNYFSDKTRTVTNEDDYSAVISSKSDLVINGQGFLTINADYRNGIKSSDDLYILGGNISVTASEDGIIGKDRLGITGGTFNINAGTDAFKANNDSDTSKGYIIINDGNFNLTAANDAIGAETNLAIRGGTYNIKTGDGAASVNNSSNNNSSDNKPGNGMFFKDNFKGYESDSESIKGLKAGISIYIYNGTFSLNCEDDAIHCNDTITIDGGNFDIGSGDDAVHADVNLQINGGKLVVSTCYEGLEAAFIYINNGDISIKASDDGINASSGSSENTQVPGDFRITENTGNVKTTENSENNGNAKKTTATVSSALYINGGNLYVDADGDGIDSNGSVYVNGGTVIVCGPTSDGDTALDYETGFEFNGGCLMAFGSSGMVENPTSSNNGVCIVTTFAAQSAGMEFKITDSASNEIIKYTPGKAYACAIVYSQNIKMNEDYTVTAGNVTQTVSVNNSVTSNVTGGMGNMGNMGDKGNRNDNYDKNGQFPQMPDGEMPSGETPQMPDGEIPSGEAPQMPGGEIPPGEFPQMPNGEVPSGQVSGGNRPDKR